MGSPSPHDCESARYTALAQARGRKQQLPTSGTNSHLGELFQPTLACSLWYCYSIKFFHLNHLSLHRAGTEAPVCWPGTTQGCREGGHTLLMALCPQKPCGTPGTAMPSTHGLGTMWQVKCMKSCTACCGRAGSFESVAFQGTRMPGICERTASCSRTFSSTCSEQAVVATRVFLTLVSAPALHTAVLPGEVWLHLGAAQW